MEIREGGFGRHPVEHAIDQVHQTCPVLLAREIPLAVPMRMRDDMHVRGHILHVRAQLTVLAFNRTRREAGDEEPLHDEKRRHHRDQPDETGRGHELPFGLVSALETEQPERYGESLL